MTIDPMTAIMLAGIVKDIVIEFAANRSEDPEKFKAECEALQKSSDELETWLKEKPSDTTG